MSKLLTYLLHRAIDVLYELEYIPNVRYARCTLIENCKSVDVSHASHYFNYDVESYKINLKTLRVSRSCSALLKNQYVEDEIGC